MALISCPECSKEISDKVKSCPHCGYPLVEEEGNEYAPQQVEVTAINLKQKDAKKTKKVIVGLIMLMAIGLGIMGGVMVAKSIQAKEARNAYIGNLQLASSSMLIGASEAEGLCNLTASVWNNSIYEKDSSETDKFTKSTYGYFHSDFNTSLASLYTDEETIKTIADIESNQALVATVMKKLINPTEEFEKAYDTVSELYTTYQSLTDLAVNPTGSLQTFSQNRNEKTSEFMEYYKKLETQIPDKE